MPTPMKPKSVEPAAINPLCQSNQPVALVGAGPVDPDDLALAERLTDGFIAADGGAATLLAAGIAPWGVIGDMDSLDPETRAQVPRDLVHAVTEQDSTDFEKCITRIEAPLIFALGFSGGRMDHLLAVFNAMVRHPDRRCIVLGREDIAVVLPASLTLPLPDGTAVSLYPMREVAGTSEGLVWPIEGLTFRPDGQIGTSNRSTDEPVALTMSAPGMLLLLPRSNLGVLLAALETAPRWPAL